MVNDLKALMRENVANPPPDHADPDGLVRAGRRRVRHRRTAVAGTAAAALVAVALVVTLGTATPATTPTDPAQRHSQRLPAADPPQPEAGKLRLADANAAVEGRDYRVLAAHTNDNLNSDNGQYFDGVTDDGLIVFRDGPRMDQPLPRMALVDPATGDKDWLPDPGTEQDQTWPVELSADRLTLVSTTASDISAGGLPEMKLAAHIFDRSTRQWTSVTWPKLPTADGSRVTLGPDGRLYVPVAATGGKPPTGVRESDPGADPDPAVEFDESDAPGDTYHLWSVSLTNSNDVRDQALTVGDVAFTDTSMVWTDSTNGDSGMIHTRDLATGTERSFDPKSGARCNLVSFGATETRVILSQYCGTYAGGVRDDRVQVLTSDGDQVVTIQDSGIEGRIAGLRGANSLVTLTSSAPKRGGTYVYDLDGGQFLRVSDAVSSFDMGGPTPAGQFLWHTPDNHRQGATQRLGQILN